MDLLDLVLVIALVVFAIAGFRQGFIVGALGFAGFVGGGAIGMLLIPVVLGDRAVGVFAAGFVLALVLVCAAIGQGLTSYLGTVIRNRVEWHPARQVDAAAGSLLSVCAVLVVAWFLALAVVQGPFPELTRQVRDSKVIAAVDAVMPDGARTLFSDFRASVDDSVFPQVFDALSPTRALPVDSPDSALLRDPDVRAARDSIVQVIGTAEDCREQVTGSGFVVADERVVTNAHVVAGVREPRVAVRGLGLGEEARVVYFDPRIDLAVLAVPGLDAPPLELESGSRQRGDDAVVIGFPEGGPYTVVPARVREEQRARGRDIYDSSSVTRDVYALRAQVRPGNSGGPLVLPNGRVGGVVFAAAVDDPDTGYALTNDQVVPGIREGVASNREVDTGPCT